MQGDLEDLLDKFSSYMREIEVALQKLRELDSLSRSGSVEPGAAKRLRDDYTNQMLSATEKFFEVEEALEDLRARLKVEIQQGKRSGSDTSKLEESVNKIEDAYMSIDPAVWVEIAVSSLAVFSEAAKKGELSDDRFKKMRETYKKFLDSMTEKWEYQKSGLQDAIAKMQAEGSKREGVLKELLVRYKVGEYDEREYEEKVSPIKSEYDALKEKIDKISKYMDAIDSAVFNCYYLYSHPEQKRDTRLEFLVAALDIPKIGDIMDLVSPNQSSDEMYEKLYNYYTLNIGPSRAKARLESEIGKFTSQGMGRAEAIRAVYKAVMGERGKSR